MQRRTLIVRAGEDALTLTMIDPADDYGPYGYPRNEYDNCSNGEPDPRPLHPPYLPGNHEDRRYVAPHDSPSMALCPASTQSSAAIVQPLCLAISLLVRQVLTSAPNVAGSADAYRRTVCIFRV